MIASQTDASTRSDSTQHGRAAAGVPAGAAARSRSGTPSSRATLAHDGAADGLGAHLRQAAGAVALEAREEVV